MVGYLHIISWRIVKPEHLKGEKGDTMFYLQEIILFINFTYADAIEIAANRNTANNELEAIVLMR